MRSAAPFHLLNTSYEPPRCSAQSCRYHCISNRMRQRRCSQPELSIRNLWSKSACMRILLLFLSNFSHGFRQANVNQQVNWTVNMNSFWLQKITEAHQVECRSIVCGHQYAQHLTLSTKLPKTHPRWYTCARHACNNRISRNNFSMVATK